MTKPSMLVESREGGLYVPALDLWLDPERDVPRAFVSHAHGDHAGGWSSGTVLGSPETVSLLEVRRGPSVGALRIDWGASVEMAIDRDHGGGMARVSIEPAGHVLGAAQLVIDHPRGRLVYTGDYRTGIGPTHAEGAPVECDTLAIETTFGLPMYRWPDRERTIARLIAWCRDVLSTGATPVVIAYALGKSQALVHELLSAELPVIVHGAVHRICAAYEALGVPLGIADGRVHPYAEEKKLGKLGGVLIVPPGSEAQPMIKKRREACRVAYVSGWALIDASVEQRRADEGFVLSDHADFDDLLSTVERSGARFVYATHGETVPFAGILNERGIASEALSARALDVSEERA